MFIHVVQQSSFAWITVQNNPCLSYTVRNKLVFHTFHCFTKAWWAVSECLQTSQHLLGKLQATAGNLLCDQSNFKEFFQCSTANLFATDSLIDIKQPPATTCQPTRDHTFSSVTCGCWEVVSWSLCLCEPETWFNPTLQPSGSFKS